MRVKSQMVIGAGISLLFLFLALRGADLDGVMDSFRTLRVWFLVPMTLVFVLSFVVRAMRWRYLLEPVKAISVHSLFSSTMIGFMANNVLPLRAGEVVRAYSLARSERVSVSSALATLVIERLLDSIVISLFLMALLLLFPFPQWLVNFNYVLLVLYGVAVTASLGLLWMREKAALWDRLFSYVPASIRERIEKILGNFAVGLEVLRDGKQWLRISVLSLVHWFLIGMYYYLLFQACGLPLSYLAAIVLLVILTFGIMLPAAPGYVGNFQYFTVLALSLFAVSKEQALGLSLIAHVGQFVPVTVIGLFYVMRQSLGVADLGIRATQAQRISLQQTEL